MEQDALKTLMTLAKSVEEPQNLYEGQRLPQKILLPDNVLLFYHDFCAIRPNAHGRYTLVFPFAEMTYLLDRRHVRLEPGNFLFIRPHQVRFLHPGSKGYGRLFITFELPSAQRYLPGNSLNRLTQEAYSHLLAFVAAYREKRTFDAVLALVWILKNAASTKITESGQTISSLSADAVRFINEHLDKQFTGGDMAKALHISESNLRLRFRAEMRVSLGKYIAKQRLDAAKYHLRDSEMDVSEIARICGYDTLFAFSHFFKNATGFSPSDFRKKYAKI